MVIFINCSSAIEYGYFLQIFCNRNFISEGKCKG